MTPSKRVSGILLLVIGAGLLVPTAVAVPTSPLELRRIGDETSWAGEVPQGAVRDPALCLPSTCEVVEVTVARSTPRLVIAVDTSEVENAFDFGYDIRLHVFAPDGKLAGSDDSSFEGNVVEILDAPAGTWRVVLVPDSVIGHLPYRGYAAATVLETHAGPPRDLLPDLVAVPPTNLRVSGAPASGPPPAIWDFRGAASGPTSCYPQETADQGALRCLRFDQTVANLGEGPLELRARELGDGPMDQRVHRTDGTISERSVGDVQLHLQHAHFHYERYAQVRLYAVDGKGRRGSLIREGRKQGFCMADVKNMWFGSPKVTHPQYVDPETCDGRDEAPGFSRVGISPGWADTYPWFMLDQYLEISGVPDGRYLLQFSVNETGALAESDARNNVASVVFDLSKDDKVTVRSTVEADVGGVAVHAGTSVDDGVISSSVPQR